MNLYDLTVPQFIRSLGQVHAWLDLAQTHAERKKFDPGVLLNARLAPDQFAFVRQIQIFSDNAKGAAARLAGLTPPVFADDEKTFGELHARVDKTIAFLRTLEPAQFEGAAERTVTLPYYPNKALRGFDYLVTYALPNMYFHATTAYAILRHNGVEVGKRDFLGDLPFFDL